MEHCTKREFIMGNADIGFIELIDRGVIRVVPCACGLPNCRGWKPEPTGEHPSDTRKFEKECLECGHIWRDEVPPPDASCPKCGEKKEGRIVDFGLGEGNNEN